MKLQILVPQYHETDEIVKPLLDSIALQQGIDLKEVGVIIQNDGSDIILSKELIDSYPFEIEYWLGEHQGVSATRNALLDLATADYVMFCDADDMFHNACGLFMVFREMDGGFDSFMSSFIEESRDPGTGDVVYVSHKKDPVFVHGKVHRREYLVENNIRWNPALKIHEDSYFHFLCHSLSTNLKYCSTPFYMWKWRDESVCRHDPLYDLKTCNNFIDSNEALADELIRREKMAEAAFYICFMVFDAYYTMNKPEWMYQKNRTFRDETELRFARYFKKFKYIWDEVPPNEKTRISRDIRSRQVLEGMQMETTTINKWLDKIDKL